MDEDHPLELARQELKRVNHLYYVSLKYTRTVDVVRNVLERMINCMSNLLDAVLIHAEQEGHIKQKPQSPGTRAEALLKLYPDDAQLRDFVLFYQKIRHIFRSPFTRREEYRRHVTMISSLDTGEIIEISIDSLKENFDTVETFFQFVKQKIHPEEKL